MMDWNFTPGAVFPAFASSAFGLEGLVAAELRRLKMSGVRAENGGVRFEATVEELFQCNLRLRFGDRVFLLLAEKNCITFEELYQLISAVPWERMMAGTEAINISCRCARSTLMSPRDCQSVSKKAVIERLRRKTRRDLFPESGAAFPIQLTIHENRVRVLLNTSGPALSRRGYRTWNGEAPLRETLASALVELSPWRPGMPLHDPCCGTGTILIEAAFRQAHQAPGLTRPFAMEDFSFVNAPALQAIRNGEAAQADLSRVAGISGSDISREALDLAGRHLKQAGLEGRIPLRCEPLESLQLEDPEGVFICNPPYGERLNDQEACRKLYRELRLMKDRHPGWSLCAISSDPGFERAFGRRADKKRRLYNGTLECTYYTFISQSQISP